MCVGPYIHRSLITNRLKGEDEISSTSVKESAKNYKNAARRTDLDQLYRALYNRWRVKCESANLVAAGSLFGMDSGFARILPRLLELRL